MSQHVDLVAGRRAFDGDRVASAVRELLVAIGEDPDREGLKRTPERVARAYAEQFAGLYGDPADVLETVFDEGHQEMVLVKDIDLYSTCIPAGQEVDAVRGSMPARDVHEGEQLWTLVDGRVEKTIVVDVTTRRSRALVEVSTGSGRFVATPDHPFATPDGWAEASNLAGRFVEWTPRIGPDRGYAEALTRGSGVATKQRRPRSPAAVRSVLPAERWFRRHGFSQDTHRTDLVESRWVKVDSVRPISAVGTKPYTVYSFTCEPHPTFLVAGHLSHNCEHHLAPFHGVAHVGYIPNQAGEITGISKLARLVDLYAKRPQVQERLTSQVADALVRGLSPRGVIVVIQAEHLCMSMRGVRKPGARTVTSAVRGTFESSASTRAEAMSLILG